MTQKRQHILVIKLGALGDFIGQTGQMKAIRRTWPDAHITLMTGASLVKLAQMTGWFDDFIIDNRTWNPVDWMRIVGLLAWHNWDMILDIQMQNRTKKKYYTLSRLLAWKPWNWAFEAKDGYCVVQVKKKIPLTWGRSTRYYLPVKDDEATLDFCHGENKNFHLLPKEYVLLIPGCSANHPYKRWPAKSYTALAQTLASQGIATVVLGTSAEEQEITSICSATPQAVNFCNKSSLLDIPDLARRAIAVVGNDTGPMHMAEVAGAPAVTLFCEKTKTSASKLKNVHNLIKPDISEITVEEVMAELQSLMHKAKKSALP